MAITERDLKKLWGLSGGRCAFPGCNCDCLPFLDERDPTVIGEMAHVIAKSPTGPRGGGVGGDDTYENLVLLCPTHHTLVQQSPRADIQRTCYMNGRRHTKKVSREHWPLQCLMTATICCATWQTYLRRITPAGLHTVLNQTLPKATLSQTCTGFGSSESCQPLSSTIPESCPL